jgi:hypothetical protein
MIAQTITTSFKQDILQALQSLTTDVLKMALYTGAASLDADTTIYTTLNEVTGTGYVAGGKLCSNVTINTLGTTVYVSFDNVQWTGVSFNCRGALIYNTSKSNRTVAVLNFGSDKLAGPNFTVTLPANSANSALIRI